MMTLGEAIQLVTAAHSDEELFGCWPRRTTGRPAAPGKLSAGPTGTAPAA
jgi:hypothetical protein